MAFTNVPCGLCGLPVNKDDESISQKHCYPNQLILALLNKHEECLVAWIESGLDVDYNQYHCKYTPVMLALMNNFTPGVKCLLNAGCKVNEIDVYGATALLHAVAHNNEQCVELLLESGADYNAQNLNMSPLQFAAYRGNEKSVKLLVAAGQNPNEYSVGIDATAPLVSTAAKHDACVSDLLVMGAQIKFEDNCGETALSLTRSSNCAQILIDAGAVIDVKGKYGYTPSMKASAEGCHEFLQTLLQNGANVNYRAKDKSTPILVASSNGQLECIKVLVDYGADLNVTGQWTSTPLIEAALHGFTQCVRYMLMSGALVNCAGDDSKSLPASIYFNNKEAIMLMFSAGEKLCDKDSMLAPDEVKFEKQIMNLKHFCRRSIRKHLLDINQHEHLFHRVPKLGLPPTLLQYVLYNMSL